MKNIILLKLAVVTSLCVASQAFGWTWRLHNASSQPVVIRGEYSGCKDDADQQVAPGETKTFNAKDCLMTAITGYGSYGYVVPYRSSGQRTYDEFYVIGPIGGHLLVGRFVQ